jgi:hypothetical protein
MKNLFVLLWLTAFSTGLSAQELDSLKAIMDNKNDHDKTVIHHDTAFAPVIVQDNGDEVKVTVMNKEIVKVVESGDSTYVKIGNRGVLQVIEQPDSTRIRVGDKEISIVERGDDTNVRMYDVDEDDHVGKPRFRGHWAGFEWGINNFLDKDNTISREGEDWFMDLNTGRSWAINLNFAQYSLGFGSSQFGALTGFGLVFNNYFFDHNNSIAEVDDYVVVDSLEGNIAKSKLSSTFIRVPVLLEVQFPHVNRCKRIFLSAGLVAALKLGSHTKVVFKDDNGKDKDKNNDDFNINPLRYGVTARIGYGNVSVFGEYYLTPMFTKNKGPELHPFTIGLAMAF